MPHIEPEELGQGGKHRNRSEAQAVAAWLVREAQGIRLTELAEKFGRDLSSMSIAASRVEQRAKTDKTLAQKLAQLKIKLHGYPESPSEHSEGLWLLAFSTI